MANTRSIHLAPRNEKPLNHKGSSKHDFQSVVLYDTEDYQLLRTGYLLQESKTCGETTVRFYSILPQLRGKPLSGLEYIELDKKVQFDARKEAAGKRKSLVKSALLSDFTLQPILHTYANDSPDQVPGKLPIKAVEEFMVEEARRPLEPPLDEAGLRSDMSMAEACRLILREQLTKMLLNEAGVRMSSDIEYVHKMRVATRRSRVAEKLFGRFFRKKRMRHFAYNLRKTGRLLGAVRDLDVALEKLGKQGEGGGSLTRHEMHLKSEWTGARQFAHAELLSWLDSDEYGAFVAEFMRFCTTPNLAAKRFRYAPATAPTPHHVTDVMPVMLVDRFSRIRSYEWLFSEQDQVDYPTIHLLRIDCKYLRYNLEFFRHILGEEAERLIDQLKYLQDLLGDLNDAVVGLDMVDGQDSNSDCSLDEQRARQRAVIDELTAKVPSALARFTGPDSRLRLGKAIARL